MPELPEVESVRRSVAARVVGCVVGAVELARRDIVRPRLAVWVGRAEIERGLLVGARIASVERVGKQLIIVAEDGRGLGVHLGMTGQLLFDAAGGGAGGVARVDRKHTHARWTMVRDDGVRGAGSVTGGVVGEMVFCDPRRFGKLRPLGDAAARAELAARLGPDALAVTGEQLHAALAKSQRAIKGALLDQRVLAGVGNIYADEALFAAGVNPRRLCVRLRRREYDAIAAEVVAVMTAAISAGGSTLRDYVDADGKAGEFAARHRVYGRGGLACVVCGGTLNAGVVGQRTTVWCGVCHGGRARVRAGEQGGGRKLRMGE